VVDADAAERDVRFWHIPDVQLALTNVCFGGESGHDADAGQCPLMTQSGHCDAAMTAAMHVNLLPGLIRRKRVDFAYYAPY